MMSGGVDSQAMFLSWKASGVPFRVASVRYVNALGEIFNPHDHETLDNFCALHGVEVQKVDFNIFEFLEGELSQYWERFQCNSPHICSYMKMSEMFMDGTVLFSGNFLGHSRGALTYTILGLDRYQKRTGRSIIPFFFLHDPELAVSASKYITAQPDSYEGRCLAYQNSGFDIIPQPKKYTGFEYIKEYYDQFPEMITLMERKRHAHMPSKRVFDLAFRYRAFEVVKYVDDTSLIFKEQNV